MSDTRKHVQVAGEHSWRVAVTGASGLIGEALCASLRAAGHIVRPLVRERARAGLGGHASAIYWDPARDEIDAGELEGLDAVVHLVSPQVREGVPDGIHDELVLFRVFAFQHKADLLITGYG